MWSKGQKSSPLEKMGMYLGQLMGLKEQTQTRINNINTSLQVFFFNESNILPLLTDKVRTEMVNAKRRTCTC